MHALTRLVRLASEDGEADTRLRLPLSELSEVEHAVLQKFVSKRLLVTKCEGGTGAETIEVAHEALVSRWEKLRVALDNDREFLIWRRRLDYRRREWEMNQRHESLLLRGPTLDEAYRWLNERVAELTSSEMEFITWEDRPEFQVEHVLNCGPELAQLEFAEEEGEEIRTKWFTTLVYCDEADRAILHARAIKYVTALASISRALIKIGKVEKAQSIALEALGYARASKSGYSRDSALGLVTLAEADLKTARKLALEALDVAREIENLCAPELALVARALTKVGLADEAREASLEALTDAREAEDAWDLMSVINYWIVVGEIENVYGMIKEVRLAINNIYTDYGRSEALGNLAEILARLHSYRAARETAEQCSISTNRLTAYTAILREYHLERDPSLARLFAEEEEEED